MNIGYQIFHFTLLYAERLQTVHEWIFNLITGHISYEYDLSANLKFGDLARCAHMIFLFALHFYLVHQICNVQSRKGSMGALNSIAFGISSFDWISMDILNLLDKNLPVHWFFDVSLLLLLVHIASIFFVLASLFATKTGDKQSVGPKPDPWTFSYQLFAVLWFVCLMSNSFKYSWSCIVESFPEPDLTSKTWYRIISALLITYTIGIFYFLFPRITDQKDRSFSLFSFVFMGCAMGFFDAMILSLSYMISTHLTGNIYLRLVLTLAFYIVPTAYYYAAVFNPMIAPDHRIPQYDLLKILTLTLSDILVVCFLVYWQGFFLVYINQILVLAGIVSSMRFPDPWQLHFGLLPVYVSSKK